MIRVGIINKRTKAITIHIDTHVVELMEERVKEAGTTTSAYLANLILRDLHNDTSSYLTVPQVADLLNKSTGTIYRMIRNRELPYVTYEGHRGFYFKQEVVEDYMKTHTVDAIKNDDGYITVREAAKRATIDTNTVYGWLRRGLLKAGKTPTGRWKINEKEFDAFYRNYVLKPKARPPRL